MLSVTIVLWGFNFTVTKYVLTHGFKPLAYSSIRYGGAALLFGALTYRREGSLSVSRRSVPLLLVAGAVGILLNQLTYMYAVKLTTATTRSRRRLRLCHTRGSAMPVAIATPPRTCITPIGSERTMSATRAPMNGCRFAKSVAREGPTRSMAVNQSTFVVTRGPSSA